MTTTVSDSVAATTPASATGPLELDAVTIKVQKQFEQLRAKNAKLTEEVARLKAQLASRGTTTAQTRVRRIPKKKAGESAEPEPAAE